jgi:hypothetical protein
MRGAIACILDNGSSAQTAGCLIETRFSYRKRRLTSQTSSPGLVLKPLSDMVWHAFSYPAEPTNVNDAGERIGTR